jgi:IS66 C-terminal element/Transposase IS66 family
LELENLPNVMIRNIAKSPQIAGFLVWAEGLRVRCCGWAEGLRVRCCGWVLRVVENAIRPIALGRKNWLFAGSKQAGERAAAIMSLIETAKANNVDVLSYLTDILTRLPTQLDKDIDQLLPMNWKPAA